MFTVISCLYLFTGDFALRVKLDVGEYSVDIECLLFGDGLLLSPFFLIWIRLG